MVCDRAGGRGRFDDHAAQYDQTRGWRAAAGRRFCSSPDGRWRCRRSWRRITIHDQGCAEKQNSLFSVLSLEEIMQKIQTQGVHHITLIGADRQTSIDFWEGVLGMPFIFEQPNLDVPAESHLYFDPGDGRLLTVFTNEERKPDPTRNPEGIGNLHHLAFTVSRATYTQIAARLDER